MGIIVLDKCYLQSASWQKICDLAEQHDLIVSGNLFYELLDGDPDDRRRSFAKFPRRENPVSLIESLLPLLKHEEETHTPAYNILKYTIDVSFSFNPNLKESGYELPKNALETLADNKRHARLAVKSYVKRTNAYVDMFHRVTTGSDKERKTALAEIEKEIAIPKNTISLSLLSKITL